MDILKYNKDGHLVEVAELDSNEQLITLCSQRKGNVLIKHWDQEVEGEREVFVEYTEFAEPFKLVSMRMDGYRWTRAIKAGSNALEFPEVKDRITTVNGEVTSMKIKENILSIWKDKIVN